MWVDSLRSDLLEFLGSDYKGDNNLPAAIDAYTQAVQLLRACISGCDSDLAFALHKLADLHRAANHLRLPPPFKKKQVKSTQN
jgi:hypothetical protein